MSDDDAELVERLKRHSRTCAAGVADLAFHDDGCAHCEMTVRELASTLAPELPTSVIRICG